MGINVRNDANYGMAPYSINYEEARRRAAAAQQARYNTPSYRDQSAEATNQRIRNDRAALGEKQALRAAGKIAPDPSTDAGFNWQTPIQVHGQNGTETVYRNDGVDPLRTGQWGKLGTREEHIVDNAGVIDTKDPFDLGRIAKVQEAGRATNGGNVSGDFFRTDAEIQQRKDDRIAEQRRLEWDRQQGIKEEAETSDLLIRQRHSDMQRQQAEEARANEVKSKIAGALPYLESKLGDVVDPNDPEQAEIPNADDYTQEDVRELERLRNAWSKTQRNPEYIHDPKAMADALSTIKQAVAAIKPNPIKVPKKIEREITRDSGQVDVTDEKGNVIYTKKEVQDKVEEQKRAKQEAYEEKLWDKALNKAESKLKEAKVEYDDDILQREAEREFKLLKSRPKSNEFATTDAFAAGGRSLMATPQTAQPAKSEPPLKERVKMQKMEKILTPELPPEKAEEVRNMKLELKRLGVPKERILELIAYALSGDESLIEEE